MKKYSVPVQFTYMTYVDVEAETPEKAWEYVAKDMEKDEILERADGENGIVLANELDWDYDWLDRTGYDYFIERLKDEEVEE